MAVFSLTIQAAGGSGLVVWKSPVTWNGLPSVQGPVQRGRSLPGVLGALRPLGSSLHGPSCEEGLGPREPQG